jgi:hypothetical protein
MPSKTLEAEITETADVPAASTSSAAIANFRELTKAYQEIASKNVEKLTASISALASVKEPAEFMKLQQKFMTEAMHAAVADSAHIVKLTAAAFTAAFKPH